MTRATPRCRRIGCCSAPATSASSAPGIYSLLPLGYRVNKRVEQIIREEMDRIGSQELEMPVVHPADVWRASGRYAAIGPELGRFKDRNGRDMVLAMTHEEVVAMLLADIVKSWRQLPMMVYHFQTKWRDEPRARGGLIRVREFVMKDAYSCDRDEAGLDASYWAQHGAYVRIFERLGLETIAVSSDVGMMGGSQAHEFMVLNPAGEDVLVLCEACGYAANRQVAVIAHPAPATRRRCSRSRRSPRPARRRIAIARRVPRDRARADGQGRLLHDRRRPPGDGHRPRRPRGQRDQAGQRGRRRRAASGRRRSRRSRRPGWSPATARRSVPTTRSSSSTSWSPQSANLVAGANREGYHYRNVNVGRDFTPDVVADLTNAQEGDPCPTCGQPVILRNGIEVGNIFKLGTKYTDAFGATYLGEDGVAHPIVMGSYGIGVGRNVACIVEAHHDEKGIVWPAEVAPYAAHLVSIGGGQGAARRPRSPNASTTWRPRPGARSCGTTATSRRESSSPTPSCSACPGS